MVWFVLVSFDLVWFVLVSFDLVWFGLSWFKYYLVSIISLKRVYLNLDLLNTKFIKFLYESRSTERRDTFADAFGFDTFELLRN